MASAIPGMISGGKERIAEILRIIYIHTTNHTYYYASLCYVFDSSFPACARCQS